MKKRKVSNYVVGPRGFNNCLRPESKLFWCSRDGHGDPIIGASVVQKGTTTGTVTDLDGNFKVSADAIPLVIYIGYKTKEVKVVPTCMFP